MSDIKNIISELEELEKKAHPGAWKLCNGCHINNDYDQLGGFWANVDAKFCVAMRNALPKLLYYAKIGSESCPDCESLQNDLDDAQGLINDICKVLKKRFPEQYFMLEDIDYDFEYTLDVVLREKDEQRQAALARAEETEKTLKEVTNERNALAQICANLKINDGDNPTERWCPKEYTGTCMRCYIVDPGENEWCEQGINDEKCWIKWAEQETT